MIGKSIIFISQRDTKNILVFPNTRSLARRFNSISRGVKVIFKRRSIDHDQDSFSWTDTE